MVTCLLGAVLVAQIVGVRTSMAEPSIALSSSQAKLGDVVVVTLSGWTTGGVTVALCGNRALRGSGDCALEGAKAAGATSDQERERVALQLARPPAPCPCVVRAVARTGSLVQTAPIAIDGVASEPVVSPPSPGTSLMVTARMTSGRQTLLETVRSSLGGRTRRTVLLEVKNVSTEWTRDVSISAAVGRTPQGGEPLNLPPVDPLRPGEARRYSTPATLSAPAWGRYSIFGAVYGPNTRVPFEASTTTTPGLLILVVGALALDVLVILVRRVRRPRRPYRTVPATHRPPIVVVSDPVPLQKRPPARPRPSPTIRRGRRVFGPRARAVRTAPLAHRERTPWAGGRSRLRRPFPPPRATVAVLVVGILGATIVAASGPSGGVASRAGSAESAMSSDARRSTPGGQLAAVGPAPGVAPAPAGIASATSDASATSTTRVAGSVATDSSAASIPVEVRVDGNTGLRDGREVRLKVTARPGSQIFGFEAFLCQGGVTFRNDADIRPTLAGKCASEPLSAKSDSYQEVRAAPPYAAVESTFRVGVGSDSFTTRDNRRATVTCGPGHPCQLALKLQFPNGFAFQALPLEYR